ncbi:redoxin domain-containing protein [Lutibacter sp. B2]|nr:redoxin domain-containing protein [Lutibacter sp. B2]
MNGPFLYPYPYAFHKHTAPRENIKPLNMQTTGSYDYFDLGDPAPDFTLEGIVNKNPKKVTLSDYKGKWVLLFFYGSDFTFV